MKRALFILTLAAAIPAFAQESQHCYKPRPHTTVCEFSDGKANVTKIDGDDYQSTWYTADEWPGALNKLVKEWDADRAAEQRLAEAQSHADVATTYGHPTDAIAAVNPALPAYTGPPVKVAKKTKADCKTAGGTWHNNTCTLKGSK